MEDDSVAERLGLVAHVEFELVHAGGASSEWPIETARFLVSQGRASDDKG
jgi:hypothetical protein